MLLGLIHEVQWNDPTGNLRRILEELLSSQQINLIAEEAWALPTTIAQRLACKLDKPWIQIDMSTADRKLAGIHEELENRPRVPVDVRKLNSGHREYYLHREDGIREGEWAKRILDQGVDLVLCLCGLLHVEPFAEKLGKYACSVERRMLNEEEWFKTRYGTHTVVEKDADRWCEVRYGVT